MQSAKKKERKKNLEELRCLAMMMVVVLHFLGKGNLLGDLTKPEMSAVGSAAWVLEAFCIVAVNVYMLISGYFLCESSFKLSRLLLLYVQIWTYSVAVGMVAAVAGLVPAAELNTHYYLSLLFPVSMGHYWFLTAYVFLYLLLPLVGTAVRRMSKQEFRIVLWLLLAVFCLLKSVLPFRLEEDGQGYDCIWYLCVFLFAAYVRQYGIGFLEKKWHCICLYVGGCVGVLAELFVLRLIYLNRGSMGLIMKISMEYNHFFPFLAAVGLFGWFLTLSGKGLFGKLAVWAGPCTLGVYLLHENIGLRYVWQVWFGADSVRNVPELMLKTGIAAIVVFIAGVMIEFVRKSIMNVILQNGKKIVVFARLGDKILQVDKKFVE